MSVHPLMSVVVGLISGKREDLRRCLQALREQDVDRPLEIIVPYDDPCADVTTLAPEFPNITFIRAEGLDTASARAGSSREHHDTLRTIGLRVAQGEFVALTEDHAHAASSWCREMAAALEAHPHASAIGGAVECDSASALNVAVWFCDFGRYQNPLRDGLAEFVSDSNVAYRRAALDTVAAAWKDDYHETVVHSAMLAAGFELRTTPRVVVWQARGRLTWVDALRERFVWARSFAGTRARLVGSPKRWALAALTPLLPIVMTWRLCRVTASRRVNTRKLLKVLLPIVLLQTAWALGELVGSVTGRPLGARENGR